MKSIIILESFDGYPGGERRSFVAGAVEDLADDYADLIVGKGLGREASSETAAPAAEQTITKPARKGDSRKASAHENE
ncbi:MAG: hypothetical protein C0458_04305 [Methylobacterium sp.]|nr:hypothetical protein [Methylobacterium sp.]